MSRDLKYIGMDGMAFQLRVRICTVGSEFESSVVQAAPLERSSTAMPHSWISHSGT